MTAPSLAWPCGPAHFPPPHGGRGREGERERGSWVANGAGRAAWPARKRPANTFAPGGYATRSACADLQAGRVGWRRASECVGDATNLAPRETRVGGFCGAAPRCECIRPLAARPLAPTAFHPPLPLSRRAGEGNAQARRAKRGWGHASLGYLPRRRSQTQAWPVYMYRVWMMCGSGCVERWRVEPGFDSSVQFAILRA